MHYFPRRFVENPVELVWPLAVFVLVLAAGWVVRRLILKALDAWSTRSKSRAGAVLTKALAGPMLIWALILGLHLAIQASPLPAHYASYGADILYDLWMVSVILMLMGLAGSLVRVFGDQIPGALPVTTLSQNLAQIAVFMLGVVIVMEHYNQKITPILTALGVGGLAVALALQDTLSNLFGGFYVAVARQVRLNDYIKLNSGEEGYVRDIGWRSTTLRALGNNLIIVPNAKLSQAIVTNYYLPEKQLWASFPVSVSYRSDPDQVEKLLLEIVTSATRDIPGLLADPQPSISFDPGFGEFALIFSVNFCVSEFANQFSVRNELKRRVIRRFRSDGIEIPFPTRIVRIDDSQSGPPSS